jgi:LemA protein
MPSSAWLALGAVAALAAWVGLTFNAFVRLRNRVREAWSGIDVQLERRHDLVPNLVRVVKAYAAHEAGTLAEVTRARADAGAARAVGDRERTENRLSASLDGLFARVEAYPELRADENFRRLQHDLVEIEEHLQYARRYYNGAVRDLNNRVQMFPANLLAPLFGVRAEGFFEIESPEERQAPRVGDTLAAGGRDAG